MKQKKSSRSQEFEKNVDGKENAFIRRVLLAATKIAKLE